VSEKAPIKVTILYKPVFSIAPSSPWLCQHDSITLAYDGPVLVSPAYTWSLPPGAKLAAKTNLIDSQIYVQFDSATKDNYVHLHTTNYGGRCYGDTVIRIKVVELPTAVSSTRQDVCLGDTVSLAIASKTSSAANFLWHIDYTTIMANSNALNIIAHNSNSGGPFSISWNDTGRHVIQLTSFTEEGCTSKPTFDTVSVHAVPDASFNVITRPGTLCLEDSVKFEANSTNYNFSYLWTPAHFFANENKPSIWGRVEQEKSIVTLLVTDPFGCYASTSQELDPNSCCTVSFPNAFTPNGDGKNDVFRPIRDYKTNSGYHRYHTMRVANRWGQTVFESSNNTMSWDGTYNQVPQDMGVYYYYIKFDCGGKTIEQSGDVTLIR
jgi:gliding motility-associated-like protein